MSVIEKNKSKPQGQIHLVCIEELVPKDHLLRKVAAVIDFNFVYELVEDLYSKDNGRPSVDPVVLVKIALIMYMFGIRSMRQTIKDIEVNVAYRWFLGMDLYDTPPHFTTFGKNYKRRFEGTDLFERIFAHVLGQCYTRGYVKDDTVFVDSTHIKASANRNKKQKVEIEKEAAQYARELRQEIDADRKAHGKEPFDDGGDDNGDDDGKPTQTVMKIQSTTDPDSGMFVKGDHERNFAYTVPTVCDRNGIVLGYAVTPGNVHDSVSFYSLYETIRKRDPGILVADAAYRTPHIIRTLLKDGIIALTPYTRPKTKEGFFHKYEYAYDEYYDCYICPNNQVLTYATTNREGQREYRSKAAVCKNCPMRKKCTNSKTCVKTVTRHIWAEYLEIADDFRYTLGMKDIYAKRKETIERVFADAKDKHGMRYTHLRGKSRVNFAVTMTYTCMNLKKLATWAASSSSSFLRFPFKLLSAYKKPALAAA